MKQGMNHSFYIRFISCIHCNTSNVNYQETEMADHVTVLVVDELQSCQFYS